MNAEFHLLRIVAISLTTALVCLLSACGQRGPLYLPSKPAAAMPATPAQNTTANTPAPTPASK